MVSTPGYSAEYIADKFVNYLFDEYRGSRHVRRIASWLGLLVLGIDKIKDHWWLARTRQLHFESGKRRFKVRYNHKIGRRGGIEIVEIARSWGSPEVGTVARIANLVQAARFNRNPRVPQV